MNTETLLEFTQVIMPNLPFQNCRILVSLNLGKKLTNRFGVLSAKPFGERVYEQAKYFLKIFDIIFIIFPGKIKLWLMGTKT